MKRLTLFLVSLVSCAVTAAQDQPVRPRILGIAEVHIYVSNIAAARGFYSHVLNLNSPCLWCEEVPRSPIIVPLNTRQLMFLQSAPKPSPSNLLAEITFSTDNLPAMKRFLTANKIAFAEAGKSKDRPVTLTDPEGHHLAFKQFRQALPEPVLNTSVLQLIHAGFVVNDRAAEDHFYKDILGFHPYWHGGMKDGQDDWVALQVPDGTDWVEYMLNISPDADHHTLGVMNHIAIGVKDIHATEQEVLKNGVKLTEEPQMGRDGKWQLNLYDPDDTRVEFMEFKPAEKPCCSEFTGPHPGPHQ
jgi:catechol 2,3-dioxygenase-like lactoylglutathione lyase family enzyme